MSAFAPIAITTGDHRGIGPEVISKGLHTKNLISTNKYVIFGAPELYFPFKKLLPKKWHVWSESDFNRKTWPGPRAGHLNFIVPDTHHIEASRRDSYSCGRYIELAAKGALEGRFSAITTGPIDKNELHRGGFLFDGHTEFLQKICRSPSVTMMLAGPEMRASLVTVHSPIKEVASLVTQERILICIENTLKGLHHFFGFKKPKIAVLGLNPHAGDNGLFGDEENKIIVPAISKAKRKFRNSIVTGPFPPDGFFAQWRTRHAKEYDAIICMYHDQGLIPVKLLDFKNTVNVTLGLPIIRTSVDHGVGYDIAGKNKADPASFCAALKLALKIVSRRF